MMSRYRTLSDGDDAHPREERGGMEGRAGQVKRRAGWGWLEGCLPPRGFERKAFVWLAAVVLGLKVMAIYHFRADSDETQHAHVVWGWVTGQLQYRDLFDNHMPLFQMICAPVMRLLGERADIIAMLRWAMLPLYVACLWAVYGLTEVLYSRRAAPWTALCAGAFSLYFYTSTEFRTDDLWAAFWLVSLAVAVGGEFTVSRAAGFGLLLGLAFAVSLKTVVLVVALGTATAVALGWAWMRGARVGVGDAVKRIAAVAAAVVVAPGATAGYFVWKGAFWIMYYCVVSHNVLPRLKRWGHFELYQWYFPVSVIGLAFYAWLIFRQTRDARLATRRTIIALTPWFFLFLLRSYWPDITREDDLPYTPLLPISLIPLVMLGGALVRDEVWRRRFWTYVLPAFVLCELAYTFKVQNLREDRLRVTTHAIANVLELTKPDEYVMDNKGDYVYRRRAYYWVLEPITKARVRMGLIQDNIPKRLTEKGVKICYMHCAHEGSVAAQFIVANYVPFDPQALDMGVLGKEIGSRTEGGIFGFDVAIAQSYAIVTEQGNVAGRMDGEPYTGPLWLAAGRHEFVRTGGNGRVGIILADAAAKGYPLLFDAAETAANTIGTLPPERRNKPAELQ